MVGQKREGREKETCREKREWDGEREEKGGGENKEREVRRVWKEKGRGE